MKGGGDGRLKRLTNFFIEALFYSERADRGLSHPDAVDPDEIDDPEECNESIDVAKKNIMKLPERYGVGLTEKGMRIYIDKITKHFNDLYSDDLRQYPRVDDDIVNKFVTESIESIDESRLAGKSKKKKATKKKKKATKKKKKATKKKGKLAGTRKCVGLDENDCKSNSRCNWNMFEIRDFDMNTSKGKQKLFDLKESLMKTYTKEELMEYLGSEDPSFYQVYMRAKKEYDNGLRGLCGHKMFRGSELSDILKKRVERDYPELRKSKKKNKIPQKDKDLAEDLLKKAMKKSKPDKEIQAIIDMYGLDEKELQRIYDKNNKQFSKLDTFLSQDQDEVSSLLGMVEDEVELDNRNKKSGKYKKPKKTKKAKKKAKK